MHADALVLICPAYFMRATGLFCVFEGIDGAGKSTLIQCLAQKLRLKEGPEKVLILQEPTLLPSGQKIRKLLSAKAELEAEKWLKLFVADRRHNLRKNIRPNQKKGNLILQDRYFYSTAAYQGRMQKKGFSPQAILDYHLKRKFPEPDLLFYIALEPQTAFKRLQSSRSQQESFEKLEYLEQIAQNYAAILPEKTIRLDANLTAQALCKEALTHLETALKIPD